MEIGDWSFGIELGSEDCFDDAKFGPIYRQKNVKEEQKEKNKSRRESFSSKLNFFNEYMEKIVFNEIKVSRCKLSFNVHKPQLDDFNLFTLTIIDPIWIAWPWIKA